MSLAQLQEVPSENMILLVGAPGSGKSSFCQQAVLNNITIKPVIYVTTETAPSKVEYSLREKGLVRVLPHPISYVDAFHETVGLITEDRPDTEDASSDDLTSLGIAIYKLRDRMNEKSLLVFDSLTSPYLMSGSEILRFIRTTLIRFAAEGNSVLACIDEGCGKQEDLVAMMSLSDGVIKVEREKERQLLDIVKHPRMRPTRIEFPTEPKPSGLKFAFESNIMDLEVGKQCYNAVTRGDEKWMRKETGDFVNLFWPNLARWSGMLWDPKRFPTMTYNLGKESDSHIREFIQLLPWRARLFLKFMPKNFSKVKDMKKFMSFIDRVSEGDRHSIMEYFENASKIFSTIFSFSLSVNSTPLLVFLHHCMGRITA